jgi:allene oxide cyclase
MRRKLAVVVAGLLVAGGAGMASIVASSSATAATTLTVTEHAVTDHFTDLGKTDVSPGDLLTFHNPIYDSTDTTQVGTDQGSCIRITKFKENLTGSWECQWTTLVNDGADSITVEAQYYDTGLGAGAITGGTGAYFGASGSLDLNCFSETKCRFTFTLR